MYNDIIIYGIREQFKEVSWSLVEIKKNPITAILIIVV